MITPHPHPCTTRAGGATTTPADRSLLTLKERWAEGNGGDDPTERATEMAKVVCAPAEASPHVVPVTRRGAKRADGGGEGEGKRREGEGEGEGKGGVET
jgi:hypothetical protein